MSPYILTFKQLINVTKKKMDEENKKIKNKLDPYADCYRSIVIVSARYFFIIANEAAA
jgi:hypothetical protein